MSCKIAMRCLRKLQKNLYEFYFLIRKTKTALITNYFRNLVWDKNLLAPMSCFSAMKDRCLNYLGNSACNCDILALFLLSWLSYSAFHDASPSNFDGKLDWKSSKFSVRSLRPFFRFLWSNFVFLSYSIIATFITKLCIKAALSKPSLR